MRRISSLGHKCAEFCSISKKWGNSFKYLSIFFLFFSQTYSYAIEAVCAKDFSEHGAIPNTPQCHDLAFSTPSSLANYGCYKQSVINEYCGPERKPKLIGFFNGVWTTFDEASEGKEKLRSYFGNSYKDKNLKYDVFYNFSSGPLDDILEVFEQREKELDDRWEIY
jgi:hypothetical protein